MYVMTCLCGREHHSPDTTAFYCQCGRPSVIDHAMRYSDEELRTILHALAVEKDAQRRGIEIPRQAA